MLNDNALLSALESVKAKIQSKVANFLLLRERLVSLTQSPNLTVASEAARLLAQQSSLEGMLSENLARMQAMSQGSWSMGDISDLTIFYLNMESHRKEVESLGSQNAKSGTVSASAGGGFSDYIPWIILAGVGVVMVSAYKSQRR